MPKHKTFVLTKTKTSVTNALLVIIAIGAVASVAGAFAAALWPDPTRICGTMANPCPCSSCEECQKFINDGTIDNAIYIQTTGDLIASGTGGCIEINGKTGVNFYCDGHYINGSLGDLVKIINSQSTYIYNCKINGAVGSGIRVDGSFNTRIDRCEIGSIKGVVINNSNNTRLDGVKFSKYNTVNLSATGSFHKQIFSHVYADNTYWGGAQSCDFEKLKIDAEKPVTVNLGWVCGDPLCSESKKINCGSK